ncbi:predicted protein [Histoplasma capsulatum H143]|uniref:Uncharacterized protein n=1 Tax=Ajellomyces capsulatus (strain H143) TaxID=544712 RepID=C6H2L5_AJECH|nr:predicted protein [Histoplasma capsulatum H143]
MRHEEINFHSSVPFRLTLSPFRSHASRSEGNISGNQQRDDSSELEGRIPRCALLCCSPNKPVIQEEIEKSLFSSALNASSRCLQVALPRPRPKRHCALLANADFFSMFKFGADASDTILATSPLHDAE